MPTPQPEHPDPFVMPHLAPTQRGRSLRLVLTEAELRANRDELQRLVERRDRELPAQIREARTYVAADASEEIAQIQDEQAVAHSRIAHLSQLLDTATVMPDERPGDRVTIGCAVTVEYPRTGRRCSYRLTGVGDPGDRQSVSARSPVGQALMGRSAGDRVCAELPNGRIEELRIVEIGPAAR